MATRCASDKKILEWGVRAAKVIQARGIRVSQMSMRRVLKEIGAPFQSVNPLILLGVTVPALDRAARFGGDPTASSLASVSVARCDGDPDGEAVWKRLTAHHEHVADLEAEPRELVFPDDKPLVIVAMGDMHIGSSATDYDRLAWVQEQARKKRCHLIQIGDFLDEMILPWAQMELAEQMSSIREQVAAASHWLAGCGDRMLAMVAGNHDLWAARRTGMAHIEHAMVAAGVRPVYSRGELRLGLVVGPQKLRYEVVMRHKVSGSSQYRASHGVQRWHMFNERDTNADVVIAGHTHKSGVSKQRMHGKMRHGVQLGAYKMSEMDGYAITEGFPNENESPDMLLVFHHDRHQIDVHEDTMQGLEIANRKTRKKR